MVSLSAIALLGLGPWQERLPVPQASTENILTVLRELEPSGQGPVVPVTSSFKSGSSVVRFLSRHIRKASPKEVQILGERIWTLSYRYGFPPEFILSLMEVESNFRRDAISPKGAIGILQLKMSTAQSAAIKGDLPWGGMDGLRDPLQNIELALIYLSELRDHFKDPRFYITAYNHGPTRLRRILREGDSFPEGYYRRVMQSYARVREQGRL
jgi:soluble lytic murein transglycosylase